jgi:hypothetical protein
MPELDLERRKRLVRFIVLRSINCKHLSQSYGNCPRGKDYAAMARAYRNAAAMVAIDLGLSKRLYA